MIKRVVVCLIYRDKQLLLQLRDKKKNIIYPGKWGYFGGNVKIGETHLQAVKREMFEELNIKNFKHLKFIRFFFDTKTNSFFYIYILKLSENVLQKEGSDFALFTNYQFLKKRKSKKIGKFFEFADKRLMSIFKNYSKRFFEL